MAWLEPSGLRLDGGAGSAGQGLTEDSPEQWAARKPVEGFVIEPGQTVSVALQIQRSPGAEVAEVSSQTVSYRPDGKLYNRTVTSLVELSIAEDCSADDD